MIEFEFNIASRTADAISVLRSRNDRASIAWMFTVIGAAVAVMRWLADHGFPSARPVADRHGQPLKSLRGKPAAAEVVRPPFYTAGSIRR